MKSAVKYFLSLFSLALILSISASAQTAKQEIITQDYHNGIGVRFGGLTSGITFKHFVKPLNAVEGILSFGYRTTVITGLYEQYINIGSTAGLRWFYGGGVHLGIFRHNGYYYWVHDNGKFAYADRDGVSSAVVGIDGIIGLDYKFKDAPINISLDMKPFVDFFNGPYGYFDGAVSVRFTF